MNQKVTFRSNWVRGAQARHTAVAREAHSSTLPSLVLAETSMDERGLALCLEDRPAVPREEHSGQPQM